MLSVEASELKPESFQVLKFYRNFARVSPVFMTIPKPENDKPIACTTTVQAPKQFITIYSENYIISTYRARKEREHAHNNQGKHQTKHLNTTCSY